MLMALILELLIHVTPVANPLYYFKLGTVVRPSGHFPSDLAGQNANIIYWPFCIE